MSHPARRGGAGELALNWDSLQGEALTQALALSGYATDPDGLRVYYRAHKDVIDGYLQFVDVQKVVEELATSDTGAPGIDVQALGAGMVGGLGLAYLFSIL